MEAWREHEADFEPQALQIPFEPQTIQSEESFTKSKDGNLLKIEHFEGTYPIGSSVIRV